MALENQTTFFGLIETFLPKPQKYLAFRKRPSENWTLKVSNVSRFWISSPLYTMTVLFVFNTTR